MNVGYYSVLFDKALDLPWAVLGLGYASTKARGHIRIDLDLHRYDDPAQHHLAR